MRLPPLRPTPGLAAPPALAQPASAVSPESVGFDLILNALRQPAGFLGSGTGDESGGRFEASAAAEMFNESGFFGEAARTSTDRAADELAVSAKRPDAVSLAPAPAQATREPIEPAFASAGPSVGRVARGVDRAGSNTAPPVEPASQPPPVAINRAAVLPQASTQEARLEARAAESARPARQADPREKQRGTSGVQLALQASESGLAVVARADRLSREEQLRLRVAIEGLLARHGLAAGRVTINGQTEPHGGRGGE